MFEMNSTYQEVYEFLLKHREERFTDKELAKIFKLHAATISVILRKNGYATLMTDARGKVIDWHILIPLIPEEEEAKRKEAREKEIEAMREKVIAGRR